MTKIKKKLFFTLNKIFSIRKLNELLIELFSFRIYYQFSEKVSLDGVLAKLPKIALFGKKSLISLKRHLVTIFQKTDNRFRKKIPQLIINSIFGSKKFC